MIWTASALLVGLCSGLALHRWSVRRQLGPLVRAVTAVTSTADAAAWSAPAGNGAVAVLGGAVGELIGVFEVKVADERRVQELLEHQRAHLSQRYLSEQYLRRQAQAVLDETSGMVVELLRQVLEQANTVLAATSSIDEKVRAVTDVSHGVVAQTRTADQVVTALNQSLQQVGGIASFIATVAEQTNLLSLNATIEAARAGAAGKGFGVVAHEVKELATTTSRSTQEISATIGAIEQEAERMGSALVEIVRGVNGVDDATTAVAPMVAQQLASVEELDGAIHAALEQVDMLATLSSQVDRREYPRVVVGGALELRVGDRQIRAELLDLSEGGLRCMIKAGQTVEVEDSVRVLLGVRQASLTLPARVRWCSRFQQDYEVGLSFERLSPADQAAISEHINLALGVVEGARPSLE